MEVLHQHEKPGPLVPAGLLQTLPGRGLAAVVGDLVLLHAGDSHLPLALVEPSGVSGGAGQDEETEDGDESGGGTLDDEEPAPAGQPAHIVETSEDAGGDETRETGGEDLGAVEKGDAGGNLLTGVEDGKHVGRTGIELSARQQTQR